MDNSVYTKGYEEDKKPQPQESSLLTRIIVFTILATIASGIMFGVFLFLTR